MADNIFLKIIRKEIPKEFVYEDDTFAVFKDANPSAPVHLLIVPKEHLEIGGGDLEKRSDSQRKEKQLKKCVELFLHCLISGKMLSSSLIIKL